MNTVEWANDVIAKECMPSLRRRFLMKDLHESAREIVGMIGSYLVENSKGRDLSGIEICLEFDKRNKLLMVFAVGKDEALYDEDRERKRRERHIVN